MHILLQRQGANTFSSQFVLRRGVEDCISHHGRALCFKFGDSPENCPPKFRAYSVKTLLDSKQNRRGDGMNQGMCSGGGKETKVVGSNNSIENIL